MNPLPVIAPFEVNLINTELVDDVNCGPLFAQYRTTLWSKTFKWSALLEEKKYGIVHNNQLFDYYINYANSTYSGSTIYEIEKEDSNEDSNINLIKHLQKSITELSVIRKVFMEIGVGVFYS